MVFTPCSVVIDEFDKYNLIARVLFSCFKPATVITEASEVITVGGLKHENNTLGIRWYLSNSSITTPCTAKKHL